MKFHRLGLGLLSALSAMGLASGAGTDLGGGVNTITDVSDRALISRDLADMFELCAAGDYNGALLVYDDGKNSPMYDKAGKLLGTKRTLRGMSSAAADGELDGEPPFMAHVYGLSGGNCDGADERLTYADAAVRDLLQEGRGTLGAEAARALNLWMYAAHQLYGGVEDCARLASGINVEAAGLADNGKGAYAFDEFMAYWIGSGQVHGSTDATGGYALYALAQRAGQLFGKLDDSNGEAAVNTQIKALYAEAQSVLSNSNACKPGSDTTQLLWGVAHRMVSQMSVPLVQMLVHSMKDNDGDRVRMYARAIVPQMSRCRGSTFRRLKENLLDRAYDQGKFVTVLGDLQNMYDCLGITCEDVGAYKINVIGQCAGFPINYPIADYSPTSNVHEHAKFDLDITELKMLLCFDKDRSFQMAKKLYLYGHNSLKYRSKESDPYEYLSLHEMATSALRDKAPWATHFTEYHQDKSHAHNLIVQTLDGQGKWGTANRAQRAEIIAKTAQYQVVFLYLLAEMADANADCQSDDATDNEGSVHSWDEVVAYYVGSQEGTTQGGSDDFGDGQMMWNLGNRRCTQFGTQTSQGWSVVMAAVEDLFYAGKGELDAYDCASLQRTVRKIEHLSLIPLIQSVVRFAIKNEKHAWNSPSADLAGGEAFALSILPVLAAYDPVGQAIVEENMMVAEGREPVVDGAQAVADAFHPLMQKFGLECQYVGESDGVDTCRLSTMSNGVSNAAMGVVASILAVAASIAFLAATIA